MSGFITAPGSSLAQFLVEKLCPFEKPRVPVKNIRAIMPFVILVDLSAQVRRQQYKCPARKWLVPMEAATAIRTRAGFKSTDGDRVVCEHMGHLIE